MLADIRFWEKKAQEGHFAIPHFNVWNAEMLMGVMDAAEESNAPVIISFGTGFVGNTSFEVKVETYVDRQNGERERINRAYLVMVALDEEENSIRPPRLILQSDEERLEYEAAEQRYLALSGEDGIETYAEEDKNTGFGMNLLNAFGEKITDFLAYLD